MRIGVDTTFLVQAELFEHPGHTGAHRLLGQQLEAGNVLALAPQILPEFVHVVTDPNRFERPLSVDQALARARAWWSAKETRPASPTAESVSQFWLWMQQFGLGRKRLLDTMLAATYFSHGITTLLTSNVRDYAVFGCFRLLTPDP